MVKPVITIVGKEETQARLFNIPRETQTRLGKALSEIGVGLVSHVKTTKLSGSPLKYKTGTLRRSINFELKQDGNNQFVDVGSRRLPYAAIHEFGGTINIPETRPLKGRAMHWVKGSEVFASRVQAHSVRIPERSFMRSSLEEQRPEINTRLQAAMHDLWRR